MKNHLAVREKAVSSLNDAARQITFIASTPDVDRMGDIVEPMGIDVTNYQTNPVVLFAHDSSQPPVGKTVAISKSPKALTATIQFATADENPQADSIYRLYKSGYMSAVSIGFLPKGQEWITNDNGMPTGLRFFESELLEISCVPVPANPQAVARTMAHAAKLLGAKGDWNEFQNPYQKRELPPDVVAILQALTVAPKNPTLDKELGEFLKALCQPPETPGSVREFIRRGRK